MLCFIVMETEAEFEVRPLRRDEYHRLGEPGYFEDEKVELLDGIIVKMSPDQRSRTTSSRRILQRVARQGDPRGVCIVR